MPDGLEEAVQETPILTDEERARLDVRQLQTFQALHLLRLIREAEAALETLRRTHAFVETLVR